MTATDNIQDHGHDHAHDDHGHPSDRSYVMIALLLGFLTAIEIVMFIFEDDLPGAFNKIGLIALMIVKFIIVGGYFMHLKFDDNILTKLFLAGLVLAVGVYWIMLSAFEFSFWNDGYEDTGFWDGQVEFEQRIEDQSS